MLSSIRSRLLACVAIAVAGLLAVPTAASAGSARDTKPPTAPANLHVTDLSFTWAQLAWNAATDNSGFVRYEVALDASQAYDTTTIDTATGFGGLPAGVTFTATVRAADAAGNRSAAVTTTFTTKPRTGPPPTAPANLRAVYVGGVLHDLAWDPSVFDGTVSYNLYSGSDFLTATSFTSISVRSLIVNECVRPGSTHTLTVEAIGAGNYLSDHSAPLTVTIPTR